MLLYFSFVNLSMNDLPQTWRIMEAAEFDSFIPLFVDRKVEIKEHECFSA